MLDDDFQAQTASNLPLRAAAATTSAEHDSHQVQQVGQPAVVLRAQWLEETWLHARRILNDEDPFLQALQRQRSGTRPPPHTHTLMEAEHAA